MVDHSLIEKYTVPAPRYTSYPTVPYWDQDIPDQEHWKETVKRSFELTNSSDGISVYIHLPFCESLCTYCGCNTRITKNHQVEDPYISAVLKEWAMYIAILDEKPIIREIHMGGGTPTFFSPENLSLLITGILKHATVHPLAEFSFEAHPANTTKEHLTTLHALGFKRLSLGIQDFDPKVQLIINRIQSYTSVFNTTAAAREAGYTSVNYDLIYGLPLQTIESLRKTIEQTIELRPDRIAFYSYAHVPWLKPGQRKYTEADLPTVEEKRALYELGCKMLTEAGYEEVGMDHFAFKSDSLFNALQHGRLHRNFMGYTHNFTQLMISLGVSSISDSWYAFAQNVKKVEDYYAALNTGKLPIVKGHFLTDEDLILRRHILNIMCNGTTDWSAPGRSTPSLLEGLKRLEELEADGLVSLQQSSLSVTPLGKHFLRNICMALDARLWRNKPESTMFSMA